MTILNHTLNLYLILPLSKLEAQLTDDATNYCPPEAESFSKNMCKIWSNIANISKNFGSSINLSLIHI